MIEILKRFGNRNNLSILMLIAIGLETISIFTSDMIFIGVLCCIQLIIMLIAIFKLNTPASERIFLTSLIIRLVICVLNIVISYSSLVMPTLVLAIMPTAFLIIDIYKKHKFVNASCLISAIMIVLRLMSLLTYMRYFDPYSLNIIREIIVWFVTLSYFIRFVKIKETIGENEVLSIEARLSNLKTLYEKGDISEEEYSTKKSEILNDF